jgi:apolipoprotein N-acyltransferase
VQPGNRSRDRCARGVLGQLLLALLSASFHVLAGPPFGAWPLAFVAVVPLCVAVSEVGGTRAAGLGWLTGFATMAGGYFWLPASLLGFTSLPGVAAIAITVAFHALHAFRWALGAWLFARLGSRKVGALAVVGAFLSAESVFPETFPFYLGALLHEKPELIQVAELGGPLATSFIALVVNAGTFGCVRALGRSSGDPGRKQALLRGLGLAAATWCCAWLYGALRMGQVAARVEQAPTETWGIVQANVDPRARKVGPDALSAELDLTRELVSSGPLALASWSESAVPGEEPDKQAAQSLERRLTRRLGVPLLFGATLTHSSREAQAAEQFNSVLLSDEHGSICPSCRYDKQILLPFGEYLPGESWAPALRAAFPNTGHFVAGPRTGPLEFHGRLVGVTVCYEDLHSLYVSGLVKAGAGIIVNLSNDAWFSHGAAAEWHFALAKLRAVEQRRFFVRATNNGVSALVGPTGRVLNRAPALVEATLSGRVAFLEGRTPFSYVGNWPWWILSLLTMAAGVGGPFAFGSRPGVRFPRSSWWRSD